ncbi:hypothetical protein KFL_000170590 [Klebsormidium nitens]|uniref:tRNA/rRNA methyltransferase SpoU type domain-containing protein n=1 Tax=Klebsormidium nitens TaxID=105231 RepID=A0A1Y1HL73_KLENI|nr:hypothetical protein KFL_000170590 [Klebsormidium nitens]|eukprot:GAQ78713.1 hypothetical protein KFL_000170590 [Klebsormidium nitens]
MRVFYRPQGMTAAPTHQEEIGNNVVREGKEGSAPSTEESASSCVSGETQPRKVKSSSAWWKKNFTVAVPKPSFEPPFEPESTDSDQLSSVSDIEPESSVSELEYSVGTPVDEELASSSGDVEDADALLRLVKKRKRGPRGRVIVQHGKGRSSSQSGSLEEGSGPCFSGRQEEKAKDRKAWFPHSGVFEIEGQKVDTATVKRALEAQLAQNRIDRIADVVAGRSYALVPVVEGLNNLANVSAVTRTAEALGCQSVHAVARERARYKGSGRVSAGSDKWLDLELWTDTWQCLKTLKARGYRIAVTCMDQLGEGRETRPVHEIDWTIPTAIVLGNEMFGVSGDAKELADIGCYIPMGGFTDSFNISHAAAILMYHAVRDRIQRQGFHADLTPEQRDILTAEFYLRTNRTAESVVHRLLELEGAEIKKAPKSFVRSLMDGETEEASATVE